MILNKEISNAQTKPLLISQIEDIKNGLFKNYKIEEGFLDTACLNTVIIVKFKIIDKKLDSIEFTKSIPLPIKTALLNALRSNKIELQLNDKKYDNKIVLIPIHFIYYTGCKVPSTAITKDASGKFTVSGYMDNGSLGRAFLNLLYFESGNKTLLDCILLSPMYFTAMY